MLIEALAKLPFFRASKLAASACIFLFFLLPFSGSTVLFIEEGKQCPSKASF